jgi:hypothetical protein
MKSLVVYSRRGCHLCEVLVEQLLDFARGRATIDVRDVDTRDDWREAYGLRVPVLEYDGQMLCEYELTDAARDQLKVILKTPT